MALVFKKVTEYDWEVTIETPHKGKFKKETFTANFKNVSRKDFDQLVDSGDENFIRSILLGWSGIKDEDGNEFEYNEDNLKAILNNHFMVKGIIESYAASMKGASEKN